MRKKKRKGLTQGGRPMETDTIESKHLAAVAQVDALTSRVSEIEGLLSEAANAVKAAEEARNAAVAEKESLAASLSDAISKVEKLEANTAPAEAQAAAIVAACKADPANVSPAMEATIKEESLSVIERLNALPLGSKERAAFYTANKRAIWKAQAGI
jgi:chromosome segregation ATPase